MTTLFDQSWLPAGWTAEALSIADEIVVIERPREAGGGMVSVDFQRRVWDAGHQRPHRFPDGVTRQYTGWSWKRILVSEACDWLERVMTARTRIIRIVYSAAPAISRGVNSQPGSAH